MALCVMTPDLSSQPSGNYQLQTDSSLFLTSSTASFTSRSSSAPGQRGHCQSNSRRAALIVNGNNVDCVGDCFLNIPAKRQHLFQNCQRFILRWTHRQAG